MAKWNINKIKEELKMINPNVEILSTEYINNTSKLELRCKTHDLIWHSSWASLKKGAGCHKCRAEKIANKKRQTIGDIKARAYKVNPNVEILEDVYVADNVPMKLHCKIHDLIWQTTWASLKKGAGCPQCKSEAIATSLKHDINYIKNKLKTMNKNIIILSNEYINNTSPLKCKCKKCSYEWDSSWQILNSSSGCPQCAIKIRREKLGYTLEEVLEKTNKINPNIEILEKEYINANTNMLCRCKVCNTEWKISWGRISTKQGCPRCAIKNNSGKNNYAWKGGVSEIKDYLRGKIKAWKSKSVKNYNTQCDITRRKSRLVHHLYSFSLIVDEVFKTTNIPIRKRINEYTNIELKILSDKCLELHFKYGLGVCLCKEEHDLFHKLYGYGGNTPDQYYEFREKRLKELQTEQEII